MYSETDKTAQLNSKEKNSAVRFKAAVIITGFLLCAVCSFIFGFYISNNSEMKKSGVYTISVEHTSYSDSLPAYTAEPSKDGQASELMININTATAEELEELNGIGEKLAARIIAYREEIGGFKYTYEIMDVSGIGDVLYDKIKNNIYVK